MEQSETINRKNRTRGHHSRIVGIGNDQSNSVGSPEGTGLLVIT